MRQVGYALLRGNVTPKKTKGRSPILSSEEVDQIENFVKSSPINRRMTYLELAAGPFRHLGVSEKVIQSELRKRGYRRHPTHKNPPVTEQINRVRKEWAEAHVHWAMEDWMSILWTDETRVKIGGHSREWVTRKVIILLYDMYFILRLTFYFRLTKNTISTMNVKRSEAGSTGCSGVVLQVRKKVPAYFGRKNGTLLILKIAVRK